MNVIVDRLDAQRGDELDTEVVERKGFAHPDTMCDALAEELSLALCRIYVERTGRILHHNVDKVLLAGGAAGPAFGGGVIRAPIEIVFAGRAAAAFGGGAIDIEDLVDRTTRNWFRDHLPTLDADRDIVVRNRVRPGSADLVALFDRAPSAAMALANDTSCGVGFAPLSRLESVVDRVERHLNGTAARARHPVIGRDIKVMGVRRGQRVELTVACALIGRHLRDLAHYRDAKAAIADEARQAAGGGGDLAVAVNAADDEAAGSIYLTVSGTSAESGDDGEAGRGNRANGLITPYRPMTMESVAGKNPVSHVGKLYNIAAGLIAEAIVAEVPALAAECYLVSRIGQPIDQPQVASVRVTPRRGRSLQSLRPAISEIVRRELAGLPRLAGELVSGTLAVGRWPLRQPASQPAGDAGGLREQMLEQIAADARYTAAETGRPAISAAVLAAMAKVPREEFVLPAEQALAYDDTALPIGHGQTISQPFIVALMTDCLALGPGDKVLEIGTGSGYGAAVLAELTPHVFSIERIEPLAEAARGRLRRLGYGGVALKTGDGNLGWPEHAPFDAIAVTAAAPDLPPALLAQLKPGGRIVIPLGQPHGPQILTLVRKDAAGRVTQRPILPVAFVPLIAAA
jgi:S-adenosylmethionine synthetase